MWTKRYLTLGENRPTWALAADVLIGLSASREAGAIRKSAQINTFLQSWSPALHKASKLPEYLKRMLSTARKYNVSFAAIKMDKQMKSNLPIWYHLGATKKLRLLNNTRISDCLRTNHEATVVADILKIVKRECYRKARERGNDYIPEDCSCAACTTDRQNGCAHPRKCCREAERALAEVKPKWHPEVDNPLDGLSLTKHRQEANDKALTEGGTLTFDPSLTQKGDLSTAFRVFVDPAVHDEPPAIRRARGRIVTAETCVI
ncbi:hypothetical protein FOMPIDRAFT_1104305, partial [Fomitopsis schrenkii]